MKSKLKRINRNKFSLKDYFGLLIVILVLFYFFKDNFFLGKKAYLLSKQTKQTKAIDINKKIYLGNSPVSQEFSYAYQFKIGDEVFEGNTNDPKYKIGDSVLVEYSSESPKFNKIIETGLP